MSNATLINQNELTKLSCNLQNFVNNLVNKAIKVENHLGVLGSLKDFSSLVNKDTRTIRRYLSELEKRNYIKCIQKRGNKGGTLVLFTKELLDFEESENPITSDSEEAEALRNKVFPKKAEPKTKYRTKAQIAEDKIIARMKKDRNGELNDMLDNMPHPTWEFFNLMDEPERHFKAYLISRMYNAYAVIYPTEREKFYKGVDNYLSDKGYNSKLAVKGYDVLDRRFIGTPRYNIFLKLYDFLTEKNIEPLAYLTVQFDCVEYFIEIDKLNGGVPFVNTLISDSYIQRYYNQESFYRGLSARGIKTVVKTAYKGAKYPIIQALNYAYKRGKTDVSSLQPLISEMEEVSKNLNKTRALKGYYEVALEEVATSELEESKKELLTNYLTEQVALYSRKNSLTVDQYLLAFPLQLTMVKQQGELMKLPESDYHAYMGNLYKIDNVQTPEYNLYVNRGELLDFSLQANSSFYSTIRTLAEYRGIGLNIHEVRLAIKEFGVEKIPLDNFGMLDVNRIYKKVLTDSEIQEDDNFYTYGY